MAVVHVKDESLALAGTVADDCDSLGAAVGMSLAVSLFLCLFCIILQVFPLALRTDTGTCPVLLQLGMMPSHYLQYIVGPATPPKRRLRLPYRH